MAIILFKSSTHIDPVARLESFRALNSPEWRILGPSNFKTLMENFLILKLSRSEGFRALILCRLENFLTLKSEDPKGEF